MRWRTAGLAMLAGAALAGCGGGSVLSNSDTIANPAGSGSGNASGQVLSFVYFERCVNPLLTTPISMAGSGGSTTNTCAGGGCHDTVTGTGGALRLIGTASTIGFTLGTDPVSQATTIGFTQTPEVLRSSDIYKNFYSSFGETVVGQPAQSRLLNKPLVRGVLHGGGQIFASPDDPAAKVFSYWISRPMPLGQDEFSSAASAMFANADPVGGACNTD